MTEPEENDEPGTEPATGAKPEPDWKAEARKWEDRAKANSAAAKKLADIEQAQKTDAEKAAEARALVEKERDEARLEVLRRDAADDAGLPKAWASRLRGTTKDELVADAKELAKEIAPKAPPSTAARPVADLKPGALPNASPARAFNADDYIRALARGK